MKPSDIKVGKTYVNRGKGTTTRTVIAVGDEHRPQCWFSNSDRPNEPGVLYLQDGIEHRLYLSSFAVWVGQEVDADSIAAKIDSFREQYQKDQK